MAKGKKCLFARHVPEIEFVEGYVIIRPADGHAEVATTPAVLRQFVKRANQILDEIAEQRPVPIRPLQSV